MVLEAHALYSEGTEMTCCSFLAVSDQSYNCISYFFLFFLLLYFVLWKPGDLLNAHPLSESSDSNYHLLSPNNPTIQKKRIQRNRICYSSSAQCFLFFSPYRVLKSMFCAFQQFRLSSFISSPATLSPESFLSSRRTLQ